MAAPPIAALYEAGQSIWLDLIRRGLLTSGELARMVERGDITGLTSNPTIFEKALSGSADYDAELTERARAGEDAQAIFDAMSIADIQGACDVLRAVYDRTGGADGYASIEVSPLLARSTAETVAEAKRLWQAVARPNVMIKIPATAEGIPAIRQSLAAGLNVNITLIFSVDVYAQVIEAFLAGLEDRAAAGGDVSKIASVASFFVSRVDVQLDPELERIASGGPSAVRPIAQALVGQIAVANARAAYGLFLERFGTDRWKALAAKGARVQRPLWASTGRKNKSYSDVKYVDELAGRDTVNTMPPETLEAFKDHGTVVESLASKVEDGRAKLKALAGLGISLADACAQLERDGVKSFADSFHELMARVEARRVALIETGPARRRAALGALEAAVSSRLEALGKDGFARRLFAHDAALWSKDATTQGKIRDRLGWLESPARMADERKILETFAADVAKEGLTDAVVLGMGGSSLCPDLFARAFVPAAGRLRLHVIDTTDPVGVTRALTGLDVSRTLFLVSTKSGNTIETLSLASACRAALEEKGVARPGRHFVAITDPGSPLEAVALAEGWRHTFLNAADIGGRYSALSYFGLVPAALLGLDLGVLLDNARHMLAACGPRSNAVENPGLWLGAVLGEAVRIGRDKLTLLVAPELVPLGAWLEQLIAESTGKDGTGVVPVDGEPASGMGAAAGNDRLFIAIGVGGTPAAPAAVLDALERAGHPVVRYELPDRNAVGAEFVRWEVATAVAGAILGVNPFDEPNVAESKANTQEALERFRSEGRLAPEPALCTGGGVTVFAGGTHGSALRPAAAHGHDGSNGDAVDRVLAAHVASAVPGDYVAILAYVAATAAEQKSLDAMRLAIRDARRVATTLAPGPRYLHSTGQLHKGGPPSGVFLVVTAETREDLAIPGAPYSFGVLIDAQAHGDFAALVAHGRRAIRLHVEGDRAQALAALAARVERAVAGAAAVHPS